MPFLDTDAGRAHYRHWGTAEPRAAVVFLHGFAVRVTCEATAGPSAGAPESRAPTPVTSSAPNIEVVYAGVDLTSPDACGQTTL